MTTYSEVYSAMRHHPNSRFIRDVNNLYVGKYAFPMASCTGLPALIAMFAMVYFMGGSVFSQIVGYGLTSLFLEDLYYHPLS